jgi:signal transduction histidine kinase
MGLMFLTDQTVLFFHLIFVTLTLGAFIWKLGAFVVRASFWVTIATGTVLVAVINNRTQSDELIEIPLLTVILILVFLIARRRSEAQDQLSALLAAEQDQTKRLEDLAVLKADFTAMVAHELGSPLFAIRSFADILSSGKLSEEAQAEILATIKSEANALHAIVLDIQNAAVVERDDFAICPRPVAIQTLLSDAAAYAKSLPGNHSVIVAVASDRQVMADAERIGQVLRNLLNNATKYSLPQTSIRLSAVSEGSRIRIDVADQGVGIHPDDLPRIFEKFGRGRNLIGYNVAGSGLGLYLSRRIIRAHGSNMQVESVPDQGTIFSFHLEAIR